MKALVISGGGSKGAFAGGIVEYLLENNLQWDLYAGTSTGSLITPMIACNKIKELKKAYTDVKSEDIFKINPFTIKKMKNGIIKTGINHLNIAYNLILKKLTTLGDSSNLKSTIRKFLSKEDYDNIKKSNKDVLVTVTNLTLERLEIKSIHEETYDDFCDWMYASSVATPFMSVYEKDKYEYADGGLLRFIPIIEAIETGATEIDAIVLMKKNNVEIEKIRNVLQLIIKMVKIFISSRKSEDVDLNKLSRMINDDRSIKIRLYYIPDKLTNNPYIFDKQFMEKWWDQGYDYAKQNNYEEYILTKRKVKKVF
jgi:NTE family protein